MRKVVVALVSAGMILAGISAEAKKPSQAPAASGKSASGKSASGKSAMRSPRPKPADTPWCAHDVSELDGRTCWFDGGTPSDGRRTLVVYMHGVYASTPGFQHLQQSALAAQAKAHHFTLLLPTAPPVTGGYAWPGGQARQTEEEPAVLEGIARAKAELERRAGKPFDETFIVGFSSGAYYASTLAVRSAIDVDGYIVLAGGSSWAGPRGDRDGTAKRAPVFVGVSGKDRQTAAHSRAFGGALARLGWPRRVEERSVGHLVDPVLLAHGLAWLRAQSPFRPQQKTALLDL